MFIYGVRIHIYLSFARRMDKFISKNISIYLSGKYILLQMRLKLHQTEQLKKLLYSFGETNFNLAVLTDFN